MELKVLPLNTVIYKEGDKCSHFYLICNGEIEITKMQQGVFKDNKRKSISLLPLLKGVI